MIWRAARMHAGWKYGERIVGLVLATSVPVLLFAGCPGQLEGSFPPPVGAAGSGGAPGTGGAGGVCDAPGTVFAVHCGGLGCHSPGNGNQMPDLFTAPVENALINKTATFMCPGVTDQLYVDAAKPASGVLFLRLTGNTCIDQMPQGQLPLMPTEIQCVTDWVTSKLP